MPLPLQRIAILMGALLVVAPCQTPPSTGCSSGDACYTPARGPQCPQVRFGWGDCPGSRKACDWCYGPDGVFAYSPRGSQYTLNSGCSRFDSNTTWATKDSRVAKAMRDAGGNCKTDGRGNTTCAGVDATRYKQAANCGTRPASGSQFTYFHINGINTPRTKNDWRGSCQAEHDTVAINLIDDYTVTNASVPRATGPLAPIKVGQERDRMYGLTCNPSGQDPWVDPQWMAQNCPSKPAPWMAPVCFLLQARTGFGCGLTPGDVVECVRQAVNIKVPLNIPLPNMDVQATAKSLVATQVVNAIVSAYQQERQGTGGQKNYFIVVAHSQGNFFAEGVAYNLLHDSGEVGREIFSERLGIVSLGSPTDYSSLMDGDPTGTFVASKIVHHTRADDAINMITTLSQKLGGIKISGKKPWAPNDPPLWPWPGWQPVTSLFGMDQLQFPCDLGKAIDGNNCQPFNAPFWKRLGYSAGPWVSNPELYAPLMNAHLLDNYLDQPTATRPRIFLAPAKLMPWVISPATTPVLNCIRGDLLELKKNLLHGSSNVVTRSCAGG